MQAQPNQIFIEKLEEKYGTWDKTVSKFGSTTFGEIAADLFISASQFSKLISGSATEGMYTRSIRNIEKLIEEDVNQQIYQEILAKEKAQNAEMQRLESSLNNSKKRSSLLLVSLIILGSLLVYFYQQNLFHSPTKSPELFQHPLSTYFDQEFDADFDSPYLRESEVQDYCPCSAYEGVWSLSEPYKLPLPGNRKPGVYYLAKSADVRMKCAKSAANVNKGRIMYGYEYLVNEIWVDTRQTPLSPLYFNKNNKTYTPEFESLSFVDNPQFKKVATIHSFFIDNFEIYQDSIVRTGEPCGRFATDVDQDLAATYEIDLKHILENVLGDLNKTDCQSAPNPFCDPNDLQEKESVITFECLYTIQTENLGIGGGYPYKKGYRLEEQNYSDNLTCVCE